MEAHLRAGIAIYNDGEYHAAHDAWEARWLDLESGTEDERFLHGLIQFTAAVFHATSGNWSGTTGLATSSRGYLEGLPADYRSVDVDSVREYLQVLAADPEVIERRTPIALRYDDERLRLEDLEFEATAIAAEVLAEEYGYDETVIEAGATFARADDPEEGGGPFVPLLFDFVREPENREIVMQRLREHVERREHRESDVEGLFEDE